MDRMTHEKRIVNVLAEDVDPSRRADDVARRVSVMLLKLLDEVIPACPGDDQRGTSHPTCPRDGLMLDAHLRFT